MPVAYRLNQARHRKSDIVRYYLLLYAEVMRVSLILFCLIFAGQLQAQVYRSVDKDGNVSFSDQPSKGAVQVHVKKLETVKSLADVPASNQSAKPPVRPKPQGYSDIEITSPKNDQAIRDNAGNLNVAISLSPALKSGDKLVLYMDGKEEASGQSPIFSLKNIDRGTHQLRVAVVDANGHQRIDSKSIIFHLLRYSAIMGKKRK